MIAFSGQDVSEEHLTALNNLDEVVEAAVENGDEVTFSQSLALLDGVRKHGAVLPDESLVNSDLILPPADATIDEVRALLSDEGLIPG